MDIVCVFTTQDNINSVIKNGSLPVRDFKKSFYSTETFLGTFTQLLFCFYSTDSYYCTLKFSDI